MRTYFAGLQQWSSASGVKPTQGTPGKSGRSGLWASADPDVRWGGGLGQIREGFPEEVRLAGILGRGRWDEDTEVGGGF